MEQAASEGPQSTEPGKARQPGISTGPKAGMLTEAQYRDRIRRRFFRTLDYASIAFSMLCIYGFILICEYLLINLIGYLFQSELKDSSYLATTFRGIRIGLALLSIVLATIHGVRSGIEQYRLDEKLTREDEKPHV